MRIELHGLRDHALVLGVSLTHHNFDHYGLRHLGGSYISDLFVPMRIRLLRFCASCLFSHSKSPHPSFRDAKAIASPYSSLPRPFSWGPLSSSQPRTSSSPRLAMTSCWEQSWELQQERLPASALPCQLR